MNKAAAADTNVLLYIHDTMNHLKRNTALDILFQRPKIPAQVISEYLNVARKILPLSKEDLLEQTAQLLGKCEVVNTQFSTLTLASNLVKSYRFQLFDAVIVAACLEGNCDTLYSEDMQDGLVVNRTLTIINPFL